ncbi:dTDP-4-dehydrorhamnose 3,5-epimerase [Gammaproteobacteria bacterium]|nr:dTDP-4-dehydrorhamnose 3,5-epimerase [Gammaproteobacteria bacterium]
MKFTETKLKGAYVVDLSKIDDERGFFARAFCTDHFSSMDLAPNIAQVNMSFNKSKGTLRGMHYQKSPYQETKFIRCIRGSIHDVIIDLRKDSPTYNNYIGVNLTCENRKALYVPKDFAHGFITLEDDTEVIYMVSQSYVPNAEDGILWNDPKFNIAWPIDPTNLSDKDSSWLPF